MNTAILALEWSLATVPSFPIGSDLRRCIDRQKRLDDQTIHARHGDVALQIRIDDAISSIDAAAPLLMKAGKISKALAGKDLVDGSLIYISSKYLVGRQTK